MQTEITPIRLGMANAYLVRTGQGYVLIDTGISWQRRSLRKALIRAGCGRGTLKLVVLTHGDFDHTGNCYWLRQSYGAPIAIHRAESVAVERGQMLLTRKRHTSTFSRLLIYVFGLFVFRRFKPDVFVRDGDSLSTYGLDARVLHIPGHSQGSIGVLTSGGDLFCGDLLATRNGVPEKSALVDDPAEMDASIGRIGSLGVRTVYPGHGRPFTMEEYARNNAHSLP